MQTCPAFGRLMKDSVTVQRASVAQTEFLNPTLDEYAAITGSPINARVEAVGGMARDDPFFDSYPEATHRMWWACGTVLRAGDLVSWLDPEDTTTYGVLTGPPQNEGAAGHHYGVGLTEIEFLPTGVS